jgi:TRAP transporter TAXI family solute receptor
MRKLFSSIPTIFWPLLVIIAAAWMAYFFMSNGENLETVEIPTPPEMFSSSYLQIGTGNRLGTYFPAGKILAAWLNEDLSKDEAVFRAVETNGSIENIKLLKEDRLTFAMAEGRIAHESYLGKKNDGKFEDIRIVWPLWPDVVQIIHSSAISDSSIKGLKGTVGFVGQRNSSTSRTSREIFAAQGMNSLNMSAEIPPSAVLSSLNEGRISFATIQAGIPNNTVSNAVIFNNCRLISFSAAESDSLSKWVSTSIPFTIPAGYYGDTQEAVNTLGIPNGLFVKASLATETVEFFIDQLVSGAPPLEIKHKAFGNIPLKPQKAFELMQKIGIPLHEGTKNYLRRVASGSAFLESEGLK